MSKWIIGDVHGCYDTLLALINKLPKEAEIVFVGDLIDRGENSKKVIKLIRDNNYLCVLGNHEEMMIDAIKELKEGWKITSTGWSFNGYAPTMESYNRDFDNKDLLNDIEWLKTLPKYLKFDEEDEKGRKLIVSHAPCLDEFQNVLDLDYIDDGYFLWNRKIPKIKQDEYFNIFGHNIVKYFIYNKCKELKIDRSILKKDGTLLDINIGYADIDTGCFDNGMLSAIEFPSMKVIQQKNIE